MRPTNTMDIYILATVVNIAYNDIETTAHLNSIPLTRANAAGGLGSYINDQGATEFH